MALPDSPHPTIISKNTRFRTLGVIRSRVERFISGERHKIWEAAISLGHV